MLAGGYWALARSYVPFVQEEEKVVVVQFLKTEQQRAWRVTECQKHTVAGGDPFFSGRNLRKKKTRVLTLASRNVRTLLDNIKANRPERRTALVARKLTRYKIDIAALSETRFADKGQLTETGGSYTFFWSGWVWDLQSKQHMFRSLQVFLRVLVTA
ncbi:hypothetical protein ACOMHN_000699 [Nucella lapillus]